MLRVTLDPAVETELISWKFFLSLKKDVDVLKSNEQEVNTKVTRLEHGDFTADMERKITDIADASQTGMHDVSRFIANALYFIAPF